MSVLPRHGKRTKYTNKGVLDPYLFTVGGGGDPQLHLHSNNKICIHMPLSRFASLMLFFLLVIEG